MTMFLDAITVVVIAIFAVASYRKGFLNTIVVLLGSIGAVVASLTYSQPIAELVYKNYLYDKVAAMVAEHLDEFTAMDMQAFAVGMQELAEELPAFLSLAIKSELGRYAEQWYQQILSGGSATITAAIANTIVAPIAIGLLRVIVFFVLFSVLMLLVKTVAKLLRTVNYLPLIGTLNVLLGGVLGALQGMLYMFVISAVLWFVLLASGGEFGPVTSDIIDQTILFRYFYGAGPWVDSTIRLL